MRRVEFSGPEQLLLGRAQDWTRRSEKWHRRLRRERVWSMCGVAVPPAIFAAAALAQALGAPRAPLITAAAGLLASLVGLRAYLGKLRLETDKAELAWITADRLREAYRSLLARLKGGQAAEELLAASDLLEARARFGAPADLVDALERSGVPVRVSNEA